MGNQGINRLVNEGFQVKSIGSLADVKKIHGEDKYNEMQEYIIKLDIHILRTDLNTWR